MRYRQRVRLGPKRKVAAVRDALVAGVPFEKLSDGPFGGLCVVDGNDTWITSEDGPWVIAYRLEVQAGRLVIAELRVYPRVAGREIMPWSDRRLDGLTSSGVPVGGLTSSVVHRIRPALDVNDVGRAILSETRGIPQIWERLARAGVGSAARPAQRAAHRAGGPPGKGIAFYRKVAQVYSNAPRNPVGAVRKAFPELSPSAATSAIHRARNTYKLLPPTTRGRVAIDPLSRNRRAGHG